jgi:3-oxoacyl-[acyl-carrier protein] reductase
MNKVALITGSGRGIGKTIAVTLAKAGYDIIINYNNSKDKAMQVLEEVKSYGVNAIALKCDISNELEVKQMVTDILKTFNTVDILVNNSAVCYNSIFYEKSVEEFKQTLDVNVIGTFLVSKYIGEIMYNNKSGKIINLTSTNGINTYYPMCIDYDASKSAIISLTHNLAVQFAPYVNVNAVAPGFIATESEINDMDQEFIDAEADKILVKRVGLEQDVANLVEFLASSKADFINNQVIRVDGGIYGSN